MGSRNRIQEEKLKDLKIVEDYIAVSMLGWSLSFMNDWIFLSKLFGILIRLQCDPTTNLKLTNWKGGTKGFVRLLWDKFFNSIWNEEF